MTHPTAPVASVVDLDTQTATSSQGFRTTLPLPQVLLPLLPVLDHKNTEDARPEDDVFHKVFLSFGHLDEALDIRRKFAADAATIDRVTLDALESGREKIVKNEHSMNVALSILNSSLLTSAVIPEHIRKHIATSTVAYTHALKKHRHEKSIIDAKIQAAKEIHRIRCETAAEKMALHWNSVERYRKLAIDAYRVMKEAETATLPMPVLALEPAAHPGGGKWYANKRRRSSSSESVSATSPEKPSRACRKASAREQLETERTQWDTERQQFLTQLAELRSDLVSKRSRVAYLEEELARDKEAHAEAAVKYSQLVAQCAHDNNTLHFENRRLHVNNLVLSATASTTGFPSLSATPEMQAIGYDESQITKHQMLAEIFSNSMCGRPFGGMALEGKPLPSTAPLVDYKALQKLTRATSAAVTTAVTTKQLLKLTDKETPVATVLPLLVPDSQAKLHASPSALI